MTLDDLDLFPAPSGPRPGAAPARKCSHLRAWRHREYAHGAMGEQVLIGERCRCLHLITLESIRRARSSIRAGKDAERGIAKATGGRRTGQYGGPDDVIVGDLFIVQSKAGRSWYRQAVVDELDKLPRTGGRVPTLVISDRPGPGHRTRRYVVRLIEDDVALHGDLPTKEATR